MLPSYLERAQKNPDSNRRPWYVNTAPTYAGIFLWIAFYNQLAGTTIRQGSVAVCLAGLVAAGLLSYGLFYKIPALLGMKTGFPLYVVGSSTFGTKGGYVMPGLLMGLLQIGWFAVGTYFSARFVLLAAGMDPKPGTVPFALISIVWGLSMGWIGASGLKYVAKISTILNFIPLVMLVIVLAQTAGGIGSYQVPAGQENSWAAFSAVIAIVIGFFATAGAAGADFGMNSRNEKDVRLGGLVGIALAVVVAGGLPLLSVAGAHGLNPGNTTLGWDYDAVIQNIGGPVAAAMFALFTIASIPPACICAFIAGNSFSTMIPGVPRVGSTLAGVAVAVVLAITGLAGDLIWFFGLVGASFGPIIGAMAADYILSGRKWAGPREGVNMAGYGAWAVGFLVGILPKLPVPDAMKVEPAVLYSFVVGFAVYWLLAKAGLEPKPVAMPASSRAAA